MFGPEFAVVICRRVDPIGAPCPYLNRSPKYHWNQYKCLYFTPSALVLSHHSTKTKAVTSKLVSPNTLSPLSSFSTCLEHFRALTLGPLFLLYTPPGIFHPLLYSVAISLLITPECARPAQSISYVCSFLLDVSFY